MKICILTPRFPYPERSGDIIRINNICRYLKQKGYTVILVTYFLKFEKKNYDKALRQIYDRIYYVKQHGLVSLINSFFALLFQKPIQIGYYFSLAYLLTFIKVVKKEKSDLYISHLIRMAPYLNLCNLRDKSIIEMTDVLSKTYRMVVKLPGLSLKRIIYNIEKKRVFNYEKWIVNTYKKCVLVSQTDKEFLENQQRVYVYTNGVRYLPDILTKYDANKIVFVGNMRTLQNQDAVIYFVQDILPIVKKAVPSVILYIIGAEPPFFIKKLANNKNIIVTGFISSVENEIKNAAVAVAPVRIAAGIQNKVLISMACGIPVIVTTIISGGIPELSSNENCIIANKKEEISHAVITILQDEKMRNRLGIAGYNLVKNNYSWNKKLCGYEEMI